MNVAIKQTKEGAFTWKELLALVVVIGLLVAIFLPALAGSGRKSLSVQCVNRLKNIGIGLRLSTLNSGDFPWQERNEAGMKFKTNDLVWPFTTISNEVGTPNYWLCPADRTRVERPEPAGWKLTAANISYFLNLRANEVFPELPMTGDSNLRLDGAPISKGLVSVDLGQALEFDGQRHPIGNVGMADGHVEQMTNERLAGHLRKLRSEHTNLLLIVP